MPICTWPSSDTFGCAVGADGHDLLDEGLVAELRAELLGDPVDLGLVVLGERLAVLALEDDQRRRRRGAGELLLLDLGRLDRLVVVGQELRLLLGGLERRRQRDDGDREHHPRGDDEPGTTGRETTESCEHDRRPYRRSDVRMPPTFVLLREEDSATSSGLRPGAGPSRTSGLAPVEVDPHQRPGARLPVRSRRPAGGRRRAQAARLITWPRPSDTKRADLLQVEVERRRVAVHVVVAAHARAGAGRRGRTAARRSRSCAPPSRAASRVVEPDAAELRVGVVGVLHRPEGAVGADVGHPQRLAGGQLR